MFLMTKCCTAYLGFLRTDKDRNFLFKEKEKKSFVCCFSDAWREHCVLSLIKTSGAQSGWNKAKANTIYKIYIYILYSHTSLMACETFSVITHAVKQNICIHNTVLILSLGAPFTVPWRSLYIIYFWTYSTGNTMTVMPHSDSSQQQTCN